MIKKYELEVEYHNIEKFIKKVEISEKEYEEAKALAERRYEASSFIRSKYIDFEHYFNCTMEEHIDLERFNSGSQINNCFVKDVKVLERPDFSKIKISAEYEERITFSEELNIPIETLEEIYEMAEEDFKRNDEEYSNAYQYLIGNLEDYLDFYDYFTYDPKKTLESESLGYEIFVKGDK